MSRWGRGGRRGAVAPLWGASWPPPASGLAVGQAGGLPLPNPAWLPPMGRGVRGGGARRGALPPQQEEKWAGRLQKMGKCLGGRRRRRRSGGRKLPQEEEQLLSKVHQGVGGGKGREGSRIKRGGRKKQEEAPAPS